MVPSYALPTRLALTLDRLVRTPAIDRDKHRVGILARGAGLRTAVDVLSRWVTLCSPCVHRRGTRARCGDYACAFAVPCPPNRGLFRPSAGDVLSTRHRLLRQPTSYHRGQCNYALIPRKPDTDQCSQAYGGTAAPLEPTRSLKNVYPLRAKHPLVLTRHACGWTAPPMPHKGLQ